MLSSEEFQSTLNFLRQNAIQESNGVKDLVYYQLKWELKQKIGPKFNEHLQRCFTCDKPLILDHFTRAVAYLYSEITNFFNICEISNPRSNEPHRSFVDRSDILQFTNAVLFHTIHPQVFDAIKTVYRRTFSSYYQLQLRGTTDVVSVSGDFSDQCYACEKSKIKCICWSMVEKFRQCNAQLLELDLLDRLAGDIVVQIAKSTIEEQVKTVCDSIYDVQHLALLSRWLSTSILPWLAEVYCLNDNASKLDAQVQIPKQSVRQHSFDYQSRRLFYHLHDIYANYLIDRLFPIIIDFPETLPVVEDLKACLERVDLRQNLTLTVRRSLEKRLLHPGVNTADILTAYIQTVKTLRSIDPSGVLMDNVCAPIRQYLRSRSDTVRCIVSFITESRGLIDIGNPDIIRPNPEPRNDSDSDDEDDVVEDWRKWNPDPWGVDVSSDGKSNLSKKSADIIGMLVEVYGSREMFVREYSQLLAERLLKSPDFEAENEVRYLEMLKLRFGESEMHQCEVMLKDVTDSQRIDIFIKSFKDVALCEISALIFSAQFWPQMKEELFEWPIEVKNAFETFRQRYESLKASRSLDWRPNLGIVQIELTLDEKSIDFCVTPLLATIIYLFQEKDCWTIDEIATKLKISQSIIKRRISWWSNYGILKLLNDNSWKLADAFPSQTTSVIMDEDEEMDSMPSDEDKEQQLEIYWLYITGLLKNLECLSAERIFTLLKMFGGQKKDELTLETVQNFLQKKVRDQMLVQVNGVYKLVKK